MNIDVAKRRINEVIQVDTTANSEADFLATHVPFKHIKIRNGGGNTAEYSDISEEDIFSNS